MLFLNQIKMFGLCIGIFLIYNFDKACACKGTADVKTNMDVLENLAKVVGFEEGSVDILDNMREVIGVQEGGVVGVAADGVKVDTDITTGGITIGIIAVIFGIMFFLIVIYLLRNNLIQKDTENSSTLQVRIL